MQVKNVLSWTTEAYADERHKKVREAVRDDK